MPFSFLLGSKTGPPTSFYQLNRVNAMWHSTEKLKLMLIPAISLICAVTIGLAVLSGATVANQKNSATSDIETCRSIVISSPRGNGVSYRGTVRNSDYRFTAVIPPGLTGWGAGESAPFHGFIVYLDNDDDHSCIDFQVAIQVDISEDETRVRERNRRMNEIAGRKIEIDGKQGLETVSKGYSDGISFDNITDVFEFHRTIPVQGEPPIHDTDGMSIRLLTPTKERNRTEPIFREFLSQLRFQ